MKRTQVMALLAVWTPTNDNESFGCTLPGFSGTNSAGESLDDCVKNIQEAFDMMTEDRPLKGEDLEVLVDPKHMLVHEDDILVDCWWKIVLLEANVEDDLEFTYDYLVRRDCYRNVEAELTKSIREAHHDRQGKSNVSN